MEALTDRTLNRAIDAFEGAFGVRPEFGAMAPGRVNLIGEHTDYNGGYVLPIAIDRATVAVGSPALSRSIVAADLGERYDLDEAPPRGSWASYVTGVLRLMHAPPMRIAFASSVPMGGGLSSSAALEASVATLVEGIAGRIDPIEKVKRCQRAEHEDAGVPCGIMDQMISVGGRAGCAMLLDCRTEEARMVAMPGDASIVVANSNVRHALASGEYASRRASCEGAAA
ncbi:MAG: hypothetical protein KDA28_15840, partial [Phycisphaerales bacterium]|nr:hypothetical protein [Phycisphaerales bacterium]